MKWPTTKLGNIADFKNGINYSAQNVSSGIPVYGVSNFQKETYAYFDDLDEVDPTVVRDEDLLKADDILFVRSNGNRNLIGRSVFVRNPPEKITHSGFTIRCRFKSRDVCPRFYAYVFKTKLITNVLTSHGGGTNINNLNQQILSNLEVPFPAIADQEEISSYLEIFDQLIEINSQRIQISEAFAGRLYREWFVNFKFPGHENVKLVDSGDQDFGLIPEGWEVKPLGEIAIEVRNTVSPSEFSNYEYYYGLEHIPRKSFTLGKCGKPSDAISSKLSFTPGDVLFGKIRPYFHKVGFAETHGLCSSDTIVIRSKDTIEQSLVRMITFSGNFVAAANAASKGTKMPRADWGVMSQYLVPHPPSQVLEAFNSIIGPISKLTHTLTSSNSKLENIRDLLLPKLISGEIDVSSLNFEDILQGDRKQAVHHVSEGNRL